MVVIYPSVDFEVPESLLDLFLSPLLRQTNDFQGLVTTAADKLVPLSLEKLFCFSVFGFDIGKLLFELGLLLALGWVHEVEPVAESDGWLDCGREVSSSSGSYYDTSAHIGVVVMVVVFKSVA